MQSADPGNLALILLLRTYKVHIPISPVVPAIFFTAKLQTLLNFRHFFHNVSFSVLGSSPEIHIAFTYRAPLISSDLPTVTAPQSFLVLHRSLHTGSVLTTFEECPSFWVYLLFPHD